MMRFIVHDSTAEITCTQHELDSCESAMASIWGTPNATIDGEPISEVYIGNQQRFMYDRVIATPEDFEAQTAYLYSLGNDEESASDAFDAEFTIHVPRYRGQPCPFYRKT